MTTNNTSLSDATMTAPINSLPSPSPSPLERLPSEVRRAILHKLELPQLSALVHASPVFHEQYLLDRRFLLCKCLEKWFHSSSITIDACAAYRTGSIDFARTRTKDKINHFLQSYKDQRSLKDYSIFSEGLTEDEVVEIAAFHSSIIKPLVRQYTDWALTNLADETESTPIITPLSETEEIRLLRALYRFQICCNLFGRSVDPHRLVSLRKTFDSVEIVAVFLCLFEPWEAEEVYCIFTFSKEMYEQIFEELQWDLDKDNPKFPKFDDQGRPPTPDGAFDLTDEYYLIGTISSGLGVLHRLLFTSDHAQRVLAAQELICLPLGDFLDDDCLDDFTQALRREQHPSHRDEKEVARDPLPFEGDKELCPPLAWTTIWRGTYSNRYGGYLDYPIRRWGYIMWDAARLEETGGVTILAGLWERNQAGGWNDPRDSWM